MLCINGTNHALGAVTPYASGTKLSSLGSYQTQYSGLDLTGVGMYLYEVLIWYRALSDDDLLWVMYVSNDKWRIW